MSARLHLRIRQLHLRLLPFIIIFPLLLACVQWRGGRLLLARGGEHRAVIVVAWGAPAPEKHAAEELAAFLGQATGATFPIVNTPPPGAPALLVGEGAARLAIPSFSSAAFQPEEICIKTVGCNLVLAGGRPRGTLYAVYSFLENQVGCRWWSANFSTIPARRTLAIPQLDIRYNPPLEYRDVMFRGAHDIDWAARNKNTGVQVHTDEAHGGKMNFALFVHTFYRLIPPERYFKDHPEWFSMIKGKRTADRAQLCLSNEEMRRELVKNIQEILRAQPGARVISVSQNDWYGRCECPACAAIEAEEGSPAGNMIRFVNAVAADIEPEFPGVSVITLAYQYTRKPPRLVRPRQNVIVQLCSIECSFREPLTAEVNRSFRDDIVAWSKLTSRLYIWDYVVKFSNYFYPFPNLHVLGSNVRFFLDHGAIGLLEEGAHNAEATEMAELRAWVLAKLLWNPKLDENKLIDEFLRGYYGPAARAMKDYLDLLRDAASRSKQPMTCGGAVRMDFVTLDVLTRSLRLLATAEHAARKNPEFLAHVRAARLPVLAAILTNWQSLQEEAQSRGITWPFAPKQETIQQEFVNLAHAAGATQYAESRNPAWFKIK